MYGRNRVSYFVVILLATLTLSSCTANRSKLFASVDKLFLAGQYQEVLKLLESDINAYYPQKDRLLFYLDSGVLAFYAKDYPLAIEYLTYAEDEIERLYTKRRSQKVASYFTNDLAIDYDGAIYEDLYCNIFKSLAFMQLGNDEAAFVELRRFNRKITIAQQRTEGIAEQYTEEYKDSKIDLPELQLRDTALGRYLSFLLYLYDGDYDNAALDYRNFEKIFTTQQRVYDFAKPSIGEELVLEDGIAQIAETQEKLSKPVLRFVLFSGAGAVKEAASLYFSSYQSQYTVVYKSGPDGSDALIKNAAMHNTVRDGNHTVVYADRGTKVYSPVLFELPVMVERENRITQARILLDGVAIGKTEFIESVDNIAMETFQREQPLIYFKTVMRVLIKEIVAVSSLAVANSTDGVASIVAGISFIAAMSLRLAEQADLRSSRFFPANVYTAEYQIEPGDYVVSIEYLDAYGRMVFRNVLGRYTVGAGLNLISDYTPR